MLRFLTLTCIILTFGLSFGRAAGDVKKPKPKATLHYDTAAVQTRKFDTAALTSYSKQAAFKYPTGHAGISLWAALWKWFWDMVREFLSRGKNLTVFGIVVRYFFIILGLAALVFLILKLVGVDPINVFRRKPVSGNIPYTADVENINEIDFDERIELAVAQHNYRLAVRLLYLKSLKLLGDAGVIHWEINKTNRDYLNEIGNPEQRTAFGTLTRQFEYIWYGEFAIDGTVFSKVRSLFNSFNSQAK